MQNKFQNGCDGYCQPITFNYIYKLSEEVSRLGNVPFIYMLQAHSWWYKYHKLKEPTNEEISLQANLAISYGAKGIMYFAYNSHNNIEFTDSSQWGRGIAEYSVNAPYPPRYQNAYGQEKWKYLGLLNEKIKKMGPYLMSFENSNRKSYIYNLADERNDMSDNTFISKLKAFPAFEFAPDPIPDVSNFIPETNTDAYLQAAFFQKEIQLDQSKYFMIVNRRCSPFINYLSANNIGGRRLVTMRINPDHLPGFTNWKIYNLENGDTSITFSKYDSTDNIFVGDFMPGEGKLFRLAPVMQEGGTLVADEEVIGNFDCKGEVNNNGKNITLKPGTTINFANSNARIVMNGGNFKSGINTGDNTAPVNLQGKDTLWKGIVLQDCPSVEMYKTYFKDISPYEMDSTYAVDLVNCLYSKIDGCSFLADEDLNTGGIRANYTFIGEYPVDAYFLNSTFQMSNENIPALSFISSGGITVPLIIDGNTFSSDEGNSANAIFLCNVSGGAIKNNAITDYKTGVFMLSSAMDFYNNVIDGSIDNSIGIKGASQSNLSLGTSGNYYTAGLNNISSEGSTGKCIYLYKSSFDLHKGENVFNLKNYTSNQSYHLSGTFPNYQPNTTLSAVQNCFRVSGVNNSEIQNVKWINGNLINFDFLDYSCEVGYESEKLIVDLGNDNKDTIYYKSGGSGGSISNIQTITEISSAESLIDSININTRKRNYNRVISDCQDYLSNHLNDSSNSGDQSSGIISKLFLASSRLDVAGNKITDLKTLLENLIRNNPQNESLIKSAFYYIQKCKVKLEDFESAMNGFQQIMDQNPYTYEALTASWDYSATSLLIQGQGGGEKDLGIGISDLGFESEKSEYINDDPGERYDKNIFTKEDRKEIKTNVFKSFETGRDKEIELVKTLEKKVSEGNANESEKKELETKKVLKEIAKPKKPVNISEHINNVSGDINKITDAGKGSTENKNQNSIPEVFYLSQNYPNPFNPSTKISFDLPVDSKVKLTVYDMLGREVKSMVNTQLSTGRYEYLFSATGGGSNFSSGIYFYRMEAVDNLGKKFVQTKRMVLVK